MTLTGAVRGLDAVDYALARALIEKLRECDARRLDVVRFYIREVQNLTAPTEFEYPMPEGMRL